MRLEKNSPLGLIVYFQRVSLPSNIGRALSVRIPLSPPQRSCGSEPTSGPMSTSVVDDLSQERLQTLVILERVTGALSLASVICVFIAYGLFRRLRTVPNTFIVFASIANAGASIAEIIANDGIAAGEESSCASPRRSCSSCKPLGTVLPLPWMPHDRLTVRGPQLHSIGSVVGTGHVHQRAADLLHQCKHAFDQEVGVAVLLDLLRRTLHACDR